MPRKPKEVKRPTGVPPKPIDWAKVDELLICGCLTTEIAACLAISTDTLYNRCQTDKGTTFSAYSTEKKQKGDSILRAAQYRKAVKGDNTMMVWLGKNRLEQRDTPAEISIAPETMKGMQSFLDQLAESRSALNKDKININKDVKSE